MHRGHLGCCGDCERAWRRRGKPSRDGDADLCPCDSAADWRLRIRHRLRCERPISPGRPAREREASKRTGVRAAAANWGQLAVVERGRKVGL